MLKVLIIGKIIITIICFGLAFFCLGSFFEPLTKKEKVEFFDLILGLSFLIYFILFFAGFTERF